MVKIIKAQPKSFLLNPRETALIVVDMQRDFVHPKGWAGLRRDTRRLGRVIEPIQKMLSACRIAGITIIHTREGHNPDLSDVPRRKLESLPKGNRIGDKGPLGRLLIRGEYGHDIIDELKPLSGEIVIDKPGKDSFYKTRLEIILKRRRIRNLLIAGVTTNVCVLSTAIGAHDRGFHPVVLKDCVASYDEKKHRAALSIIPYEAGIYGSVVHSKHVRTAITKTKKIPKIIRRR